MSIKRLAMFGGTFNPPHIGHIHAARAVTSALDLNVMFIPDNLPPHKEMPRGSASPEDRLEMTRIAALGVPGAVVSDIEIKRGQRSYTVDTLEELGRIYPGTELWMIVGTDMLCTLEQWHRPERIFEISKIAALARGEGDYEFIYRHTAMLESNYGAEITVVDTSPLPVSSSQIRGGLYHGSEKWLPAGVFEYIKEKGLYLES